jgi:tetratricopeptide (TPR) repeat protein
MVKESIIGAANKKSSGYVLAVVLLLLTAVSFSPCLKNGFINLDDGSYIVENQGIREITYSNIKTWFTTFHQGNYYPLVLLTYALEYRINGADPRVFHSISIGLHLVNALLALWLLLRLTGNRELSFVSALLWAVHPLRVESVAWAAEQKDLLYVLFLLISLILYAGYKQRQRISDYILSLVLFVLACFSKGMAVALVPLLFATDYFLGLKPDRKSLLEKAPYITVALVFGLIAAKAQQQSLFIQTSRSLPDNLLVAGYGFLFYVLKSILPVKLSAFHPYPGSPLPWQFYLSSLASILVIVAAVIWLRGRKTLFFGFLFYALSIIFVLQIVPVGGFVAAERYSYLSAIGLSLIAGWGLAKLAGHASLSSRVTGMAAIILLALAGTALSAKRCLVWKDSFTIWNDAIEKYPATNAFAYNHRGAAYALKGENQKALDDFNRAVGYNSRYFDAYYNRGCLYYKLGRFTETTEDCGKAIKLYPGFIKAYNIRGIAYGKLHKYGESISDLTRAVELSPKDPEIYYNRATTLAQAGEYYRALNDFNKAVELDPDFGKAYFYRGYVYYLLGDRKTAQQDVDRARSLGFTK